MGSIRKKLTKEGEPRWEARIHRRGFPSVARTFKSEAEARKFCHEHEYRIDNREVIKLEAGKATLEQIFAAYTADHPDAPKQEVLRVQTLAHDLGEFTLMNFERVHVKRYVERLLETKIAKPHNRKKHHPDYKGKERDERTYAPSTVRKIFYTLKKVLEWYSIEQKFKLEFDLFKVEIPQAWGNPRERRLSADEEKKLLAATDGGYLFQTEWKMIIGFFLETAMRAQEVLLAKWSDVMFAERTLNIPKGNTKTDTARQVPLSKKAMDILEEMKKYKIKDEDRIFHMWKNSGILGHAFKRLVLRANIENLTIHDLRHEAISRLFEKNKLDMMVVMKMVGHKEFSSAERYTHLRGLKIAELLD